MVSYAIKNWSGEEIGEASLELRVASEANAPHVVHRALRRQLVNARQGNASTKTRSEVSGGGRKPWRQKGTGRARAGSSRSPLWRGGGVIFGPRPREFEVKMNRKERRLALRTAFQSRGADLIVVEDFTDQLPRPKTKELLSALSRWGVGANDRVLLITAEKQESTYLSARNLSAVKLILARNLNVYDLLAADRIVITAPALELIREVYGED